jgi:hypothetical protein
MMKTLFQRLLCRSGLVGVALASGVLVASASHSWGPYHWARTGNPFSLPIGDNTTTLDWQMTLGQVVSDWATLEGNNVSTTGATTTPYSTEVVTPVKVTGVAGSKCRAVQGTTQVCNKSYGKNGWLGLATIYISSNHITQGLAKMNDTYLSASGGKYNTVHERRHVMCQEVAHTFGLNHQSTNGDSLYTCMDYFSNTGANANSSKSTIPNYHDYEELSQVYNHTDSTTTVSDSAVGPAKGRPQEDDDNPRNWGRLLHQSQDGRSAVYEQDLGLGNKIIRHVLWTDETTAKCTGCDHRFHDVE